MLVVSEEAVEREREVGVEAGQEDEEGRDEVVDGGGARVRAGPDGHQVDDGHDGAGQVGAEDDGPRVAEGQLSRKPVHSVLVDAVHHCKNNMV